MLWPTQAPTLTSNTRSSLVALLQTSCQEDVVFIHSLSQSHQNQVILFMSQTHNFSMFCSLPPPQKRPDELKLYDVSRKFYLYGNHGSQSTCNLTQLITHQRQWIHFLLPTPPMHKQNLFPNIYLSLQLCPTLRQQDLGEQNLFLVKLQMNSIHEE